MKRLVLILAILIAAAPRTYSQSASDAVPPTPTVTIAGRVVADRTGEPLSNVRITVATGTLGAPVALTDAEGRFSTTAPAERYTVVASKSGYARSEVMPTAGQRIGIRLRRGAAISGRVVDDFGTPVLGARVTAELMADPAQTFAAAAQTETDDRGEYRLASLPAGAFVVDLATMGTSAIRVADPTA